MKPVLYHCADARSFRVLWMLEELELDYELKLLPFPPRLLEPGFLEINPLGTIPFYQEGAVRMTESPAIVQYLAARHGGGRLEIGRDEPGFGDYLNALSYGEATLTFRKRWCCAIRGWSRPNGGCRKWRRTMPAGTGRGCAGWRRCSNSATMWREAGSPPPTFRWAMRSCWHARCGSTAIIRRRSPRTGSGWNSATAIAAHGRHKAPMEISRHDHPA
jgi:hypothetical protein